MSIEKQYHRVKHLNTRIGPQMVSWDITNRCNLRCKHCFNHSGESAVHNFENELTKDELLRVAGEIIELHPEQCCLCGGEPLLNEHIFDIIHLLNSNGIMVNMVSNGLLISEEVILKLKKAGISHIQVSIDGLGYQHDIFRNKKGAFEQVIHALKLIIANGITAMVSFCPNKLNVNTFELYVSYLYDLGCREIRSMPFLPLGRGKSNSNTLMLDSYEMFLFVDKINRIQAKYKDMKIHWGDPLEHLMLVLTTKRKYPIIMGISSVGDITLTPYIPIIVGNIKKTTLRHIWDNGYRHIWRNPEILNIVQNVENIYQLSRFENVKYNIEVGKYNEQAFKHDELCV